MKRKNKTIDLLEREKCFLPEEKEIIEYGIKQGKIIFVSILVTLVLGIIFGIFWQSILFLLTFVPLRMYAGGYHADTQFKCGIISISIVVVGFWCLSNFTWNNAGSLIVGMIGFFTIFLLAPVENDRKQLEKIEKRVYRIKIRKILMIETALLLIFVYLEQKMIVSTVTFSFLLVAIFLLMGKKKYSIKKYNKI